MESEASISSFRSLDSSETLHALKHFSRSRSADLRSSRSVELRSCELRSCGLANNPRLFFPRTVGSQEKKRDTEMDGKLKTQLDAF